jgi:hypothetical protein
MEGERRFGEKQLSADMEGDGASLHRTPNLSSRVVLPTLTKGPLVSGRPETKGPPFVTGGLTTRDKRRISRGMPLRRIFAI